MSRAIPLNISLFQIKLFLETAESKSFSKTAEIMHIEQSTLSRRIAVLEQELGFPLFNRESRPIQLTRKGRILYEQWKPLIGAFEHTLSMIYSQREDLNNTLNVCMVDSGVQLNDVPAINRRMREVHPDVALIFHYSPMSQWADMLERGLCDVAVTVAFDAAEIGDDFIVSELVTVPKLVCMLRSNPLSKKERISYEDLAQQHFVSISDSENPRHSKFIRKICNAHGIEPHIDRRSPNAHGLTSMLQNDDEVLVCDRFLRGYDNPVFKLYELPNTFSSLCAICSKESENPYIQSYIKLLRSFYNNLE